MPRKVNPELTVDQERFVRMRANGMEYPEIIKELFGLQKGDEGYHSYECRLSRWSKHPKYEEVWKDEVRKQDYGDYALARVTLRRSMKDQSDKWLAMQSAVNVMNNSGKRIFGAEENAVTVRIEGRPDLGSPDQVDE